MAPVGISLTPLKKRVFSQEMTLYVRGGSASVFPMATAAAAGAERGSLRGGARKDVRLALRAFACKMTRLAAGKTDAASRLFLKSNKSASNLSGKRVGILTEGNHFLKGAGGFRSLEDLATCWIGIFKSKLFNKRVVGICNTSGTVNGFQEARDKSMVGFIVRLLYFSERELGAGRGAHSLPGLKGRLGGKAEERVRQLFLFFNGIKRFTARNFSKFCFVTVG